MSTPFKPESLTPRQAIALGAFVVGLLDFAYASIFLLVLGVPWYRAWQSVASAVLGPAARQGGAATPAVVLGVVLHFCVATAIVLTAWLICRWIPLVRRTPGVAGVVFGIVAFFVMNGVVVPLTRIGSQPLNWTPFQIGAVMLHALALGPVAIYFGARAAESRRAAATAPRARSGVAA